MKLALDTLDDRREIWHLLHRLPPPARVRFVEWACGQVEGVRGNRPCPMPAGEMIRDARRCGRGDERLTNSAYMDLLMLACQWGLDMDAIARQLETWVRKGPPPAVSACALGAGTPRTSCSTDSARLAVADRG